MAGKRIAVFSLFGLVALALTVFASTGTEAGTYKPSHKYALTESTLPAANSDSTNFVAIYVPDLNYEDSSMFTLTPIDMWSKMGNQIPVGAKMGLLAATSTVGVANAACAAAMTPNFKLHNASTDPTDVLGPADMYFMLKYATGPGSVPIPYGKYNPAVPDYLEGYPYFLNQMFDPDGAGPLPPLVPRARYAGHGLVAGMNILIQVVVFDPGQLSLLPGIYQQMGSQIGTPSAVILNNPISQEEAPGAISDFCTPLMTTTTLYTPTQAGDYGTGGGGIEAQRNPAAGAGVLGTGTIISRSYSRSERDADGDGIENDLDPCPYTSDAGWDPRAPGGPGTGDNDNDGLPDTCDPNDAQFNDDQDVDGYLNRQDICPLVANGCTTCGTCHATICNAAWDNQADDDSAVASADLGPNPDSIANACDDSDDDGREDGCPAGTCNDGIDNGPLCNGAGVDGIDGNDADCIASAGNGWTGMDKGELAHGNTGATVWGTNPGTGEFYHEMPWSAVCIGDAGSDTDNDGYCNALECVGTYPSCTSGLGSNPANGPETDCADTVEPLDDDGDTYVNDGCPAVGNLIETGAQCANSTSDDTPTPDAVEQTIGVRINDGCPTIGIPESLVIDAAITAGNAQPSNKVPASCNDGIDNDGDTTVDTDSQTLGCNPADASYANDADKDGKAGASDNCPTVWNPEQTNTDGHNKGDACDTDDDDDGFTDVREWLAGSDPLSATSKPEVCDGVDNDLDGAVDEGFPDTTPGGPKDCMDNAIDSDGDGTGNLTDTNDDSWSPCNNTRNDDLKDDGTTPRVNDGCPRQAAYDDCDANCNGNCTDTGEAALCNNLADDDACDTAETTAGRRVNDGCPQVGTLSEDTTPWHDDMFTDEQENYVGTAHVDCSTAAAGWPDVDPFDPFTDGQCNVFDLMEYLVFLGTKVSDDTAYDARYDLFIGDPPAPPAKGQINVFDTMQFYGARPAVGNVCPYGK
jgi:hypothetical protein